MKKNLKTLLRTLLLTAATAAAFAFPASAAVIKGDLTNVGSGSISGWAWNKENTNDVQKVEVHIFKDGGSEPVKYLHADADDYVESLVKTIDDGYHGFTAKIDWSELSGTNFKVKAFAVKDDKFYQLGDTISYSKSSGASKSSSSSSSSKSSGSSSSGSSSSKSSGSSSSSSSSKSSSSSSSSGKEISLGTFTTSGYCTCSQCCKSGSAKTYSGTTPKAGHTISADLSVLPLGSKVRIGSTIYTVEDIGSGVNGKWIDIYYGSHAEAQAHGLKKQEVFLIQ